MNHFLRNYESKTNSACPFTSLNFLQMIVFILIIEESIEVMMSSSSLSNASIIVLLPWILHSYQKRPVDYKFVELAWLVKWLQEPS